MRTCGFGAVALAVGLVGCTIVVPSPTGRTMASVEESCDLFTGGQIADMRALFRELRRAGLTRDEAHAAAVESIRRSGQTTGAGRSLECFGALIDEVYTGS